MSKRLATDNAVIPYAVGVDIACRMKLTVSDRKANTLAGQRDRLANLIESEMRFGMGCEFKQRREHDVMDEDLSVSPVTNRLRDKAWSPITGCHYSPPPPRWAQLGTSGSGGIGVALVSVLESRNGARFGCRPNGMASFSTLLASIIRQSPARGLHRWRDRAAGGPRCRFA